MLMRCEGGLKQPKLYSGGYPFEEWDVQQLDVRLTGPACWTVDGKVYIFGRWDPIDIRIHAEEDHAAHTGVFRVIDGECFLICVLPSGPHPDNSYMGGSAPAGQQPPLLPHFYSNAVANEDPALDQWIKPDIYVADVLFGADFIAGMLVSDLVEGERGLEAAALPVPEAGDLRFRPVRIPCAQWYSTPSTRRPSANFAPMPVIEAAATGIVYFVGDGRGGSVGPVDLHLGYVRLALDRRRCERTRRRTCRRAVRRSA